MSSEINTLSIKKHDLQLDVTIVKNKYLKALISLSMLQSKYQEQIQQKPDFLNPKQQEIDEVCVKVEEKIEFQRIENDFLREQLLEIKRKHSENEKIIVEIPPSIQPEINLLQDKINDLKKRNEIAQKRLEQMFKTEKLNTPSILENI
ncbi:hypothetical protein SS50377_21021 [Spironucleus salmonicida]|uniref:Uncharacterized protein n=1 Tax=Spironucleus salmonicida TaxID=348837 RepID=A0A9P8S223_9EUKA|nr:hypothetical protein SS50377_21021 [Spironucleus salmonicida]